MMVVVPGLLAFVFGWFAFRSARHRRLSVDHHQAMTYALLLAFFRNDMGFGGNNGLTDFKDILGFNIQGMHARALFFDPRAALALIAAADLPPVVTSKFGKVLVAIRDAEIRTRGFLGYRVENSKLFAFTLGR